LYLWELVPITLWYRDSIGNPVDQSSSIFSRPMQIDLYNGCKTTVCSRNILLSDSA